MGAANLTKPSMSYRRHEALPPTTSHGGQGFNVIGYLSASSGLGNTARLFIQMLSGLGWGVAGIDVDYDGGLFNLFGFNSPPRAALE